MAAFSFYDGTILSHSRYHLHKVESFTSFIHHEGFHTSVSDFYPCICLPGLRTSRPLLPIPMLVFMASGIWDIRSMACWLSSDLWLVQEMMPYDTNVPTFVLNSRPKMYWFFFQLLCELVFTATNHPYYSLLWGRIYDFLQGLPTVLGGELQALWQWRVMVLPQVQFQYRP